MNRPVTVLTAEESAGRALRRAGMLVIEAADGGEVLELIRIKSPDAAVVDMLLPGLPALEVCRRLHAARSHTPVILVGPRGDAAARVEGLRAGADDVLTQPVDPFELVARVEALVRRHRRSASRPMAAQPDVGRDAVTGLPDHDALTARVEALFAEAAAHSEALAVLTVDLDAFETVNQRYGRGAGDRLLAACARAIGRVLGDGEFLARAGGDELVALLPRRHVTACIPIAEAASRAVRETALVVDDGGGARVSAVASIGVAAYPGKNIENANDLLLFAHAALARAKAEGRGQVCLYQHQGYLLTPT